MIKKYFLYLCRWQLSTPILAIFVYLMTDKLGSLVTTILANLVGGLIFFWLDQYIFKFNFAIWEIKEKHTCDNCGKIGRGYRLMKSANYDAEKKKPIYLCEKCSILKTKKLKKHGVKL